MAFSRFGLIAQAMRRFWVALPAVILALGIGLAAAGAQAAPTPAGEYWNTVEDTLKVIEDINEAEADAKEVRASLDVQAERWEAIRQVVLEDSTVIPVDHSFLAGRLRAEPPDLKGLEDHLQAMLDHREHWLNASASLSSASWQEMQSRLNNILAREEFQWKPAPPNPIQEFIDQLVRQFLDFLGSILPNGIPIGGNIVQWIVIGVTTLALCAILWFAVRSISASLVAEADIDEIQGFGEVVTADGALKKAQETSSAGDYRSAVRWLYLSSLLILEEKGLLRYDRSRTNREYLRSVVQSPKLAAILRSVIDVFDRVWYGFQPIEPSDYERYVEQVTELRRLR